MASKTFKLAPAENAYYLTLVNLFHECSQELFDAREAEPQSEARLKAAVVTYNICVEQVNAFTEQVGARLRDDFDEKSEKWQESDAGDAANVFIECWEEFEASEVDDDGEEDGNGVDEFEALPTEAE